MAGLEQPGGSGAQAGAPEALQHPLAEESYEGPLPGSMTSAMKQGKVGMHVTLLQGAIGQLREFVAMRGCCQVT